MLIGIRNVTKGWIAGGLLALLAVVLLVVSGSFGQIGNIFATATQDQLATGRGVAVSLNQFERRFDQQLERVRQEQGRPVSREEALKAGLGKDLLESMIQQASLEAAADRAGFAASNAMVANKIRSTRAFYSQFTDAFDKATYAKVLANNGLSREQFEADLRKEMTWDQMVSAVRLGVHAPSSMTNMLFTFDTERRVISVAEITQQRVGAAPEPTDADLKTFYQENISALSTPELRDFTLVRAAPQAIAQKVQVSDEKVQAAYEFRKRQLATAERRSFTLITLPSQEFAAEAARALAAGMDPGKIVSGLPGAQGANIPPKAAFEIVDPALRQAIFSLKKGQTSGPINSPRGWAVARVNEIGVGGPIPSLEAMKDSLKGEIALAEAGDLMKDMVEKYEAAVGGGKSAEDAAQESGLLLIKLERVNERGMRDGAGPAPGLADVPDLVRAAFQTAQNEATEFVPTQDGGYALVRVDKITPPGVRAFDSVKPLLTQSWKNRYTSNAMSAIATNIQKAVAGGSTFEAAAAAQNIPVVAKSVAVDRSATQQGDAPQLIQEVFAAPEKGVVAGPSANNQTLLVAQLEQVRRQDPTRDPARFAQAQQAALTFLTNDMLTSLADGSKAQAKIKKNEKLIAAKLGAGDEKKDESAKP